MVSAQLAILSKLLISQLGIFFTLEGIPDINTPYNFQMIKLPIHLHVGWGIYIRYTLYENGAQNSFSFIITPKKLIVRLKRGE